jgi:hypothetical protein
MSLFVTYKQFLGGMIGFIDTIYIHTTRDYRQYSAIADLHSSQFTVTRALLFSQSSLVVFCQRIYHSPTSLQITHEVYITLPSSFLAISSQSPSTAISRTRHISWKQLTQMNSSSTELPQLLTTMGLLYSLGPDPKKNIFFHCPIMF